MIISDLQSDLYIITYYISKNNVLMIEYIWIDFLYNDMFLLLQEKKFSEPILLHKTSVF